MANDRDDAPGTCPRCGGDLEALVFDGARAVVCDDCGFADVPADLSPPERADEESWASILRRYGRENDE
ncbi:hypothetical protein MBEHAL_0103 [Halarchaeum acidiphilum MH1-52-1]|uniref:Transcription factor zinc-finger domain-containing protein n=1 Tax=Halarchaeum acidiphilum MH1-52-1 TaxID=1261545 RepID=U3A9C6_9EURY|nr:hypothetical protein [Halarchaeum acidiphilum]GAD51343.1 hypothetical protein MBEHAL_0103 [Halarchaeum acidiphilum MH1-52-1]